MRPRPTDKERNRLVRSLRSLRRLERTLTGEGTPIWDRFFSTTPGDPVRYPFTIMVAFDHDSRRRAVQEFLDELWAPGIAPHGDSEPLRERLGLGPNATDAEIRAAFRMAAFDSHPDHGGNDDDMAELIVLYREWREGVSP